VFLAWRHDPMAGPIHVWYTYTFLDSPELEPVVQSIQEPTPSGEAEDEVTPAAPTRTPVVFDDPPTTLPSQSMNNVYLTSLAPVLVMVLIISILFIRERR
jgi:hypothetical protein